MKRWRGPAQPRRRAVRLSKLCPARYPSTPLNPLPKQEQNSAMVMLPLYWARGLRGLRGCCRSHRGHGQLDLGGNPAKRHSRYRTHALHHPYPVARTALRRARGAPQGGAAHRPQSWLRGRRCSNRGLPGHAQRCPRIDAGRNVRTRVGWRGWLPAARPVVDGRGRFLLRAR